MKPDLFNYRIQESFSLFPFQSSPKKTQKKPKTKKPKTKQQKKPNKTNQTNQKNKSKIYALSIIL